MSVEQHPETSPRSPAVKLRAHIQFEGKSEYLPQFLAEAPPEDTEAPTVRYDYQATYSEFDRVSFWDNRHGVDVTAQGILQLTAQGKDPKTFIEQCVVTLKYPLTTFDPPTHSELRDRALRCVRDLFDARTMHKPAAEDDTK